MSSRFDSYMWDPSADVDPEIAAFERILRPVSANARGLADLRAVPGSGKRALARALWGASIALMSAAFVYGYWVHRLQWNEGSPWEMVTQNNGSRGAKLWTVGERLVTRAGQTSTIEVARIGSLTVSENSDVQLLLTRKGRHRVELAYGHLHAKIWAPPSYFGVQSGSADIIDMGCEFDLRIDRTQRGSLSVASGWVIYRNGEIEISVPADYAVVFDAETAQLPFRHDAGDAFRSRVAELETLLAGADRPAILAATTDIAALATDADYYTLLRLLITYPSLADSALYARLGDALAAPQSVEHQRRWAAGDSAARSEWWKRVPTQPKTWWLNWRDAF